MNDEIELNHHDERQSCRLHQDDDDGDGGGTDEVGAKAPWINY